MKALAVRSGLDPVTPDGRPTLGLIESEETGSGKWVAKLHPDATEYANVLAAAPDMLTEHERNLSALEVIAKELEQGRFHSRSAGGIYLDEMLKATRAVITKARGTCGAVDGDKRRPCFHDAGHEGAHSNGNRTWKNKKPRSKS